MDGVHDLGGRQGFGRIRYAPGAPAFHAAWEKRVNALYGLAVRHGIFNMDEYRHAIERMRPRHYLSASYYERSLTSLATLLVEKGVVTRDELEKLAGGNFPLSEPSAPGRSNLGDLERLQRGERVRVKNDFFAGHVRMPGYIRGKPGVVVSESPAYPFPDAHAHGVAAANERTYDVAFRTEDLWPNASDSALVHVGVFRSYLDRID
jgi:nitrile hydratase subunit beta